LKRPFRIEVSGGIASGKTTFAALFESHADLLFEDFAATPFWKPFYETPGLFNFEAEVSFLLHHYHQVKKKALEHNGTRIVVCDFSYRLDRAYSAVSLSNEEFGAFEAVYKRVLADSANPQLLIHVRCSPETQMRRINARARSVESKITLEFLGSLNAAVDREMNTWAGLIPILSVDSENQDFANDAAVRNRLRQQTLERVSELLALAQ